MVVVTPFTVFASRRSAATNFDFCRWFCEIGRACVTKNRLLSGNPLDTKLKQHQTVTNLISYLYRILVNKNTKRARHF